MQLSICAQARVPVPLRRTLAQAGQAMAAVLRCLVGTGRIACATERQVKGAGRRPAVRELTATAKPCTKEPARMPALRKKLIRVAYAEPVDCVGAAGLR